MKQDEIALLEEIKQAAKKGSSYKISDAQKIIAKNLVEAEKCFWSLDYEHVSPYDK